MPNETENSQERRANPRLHKVLAIEINDTHTTHKLFAVDISASGFRVAGELPLPEGKTFDVKIHLHTGPSISAKAIVVWTRNLPLGLFQSGCRFEELSSKDDFTKLLRYIERELPPPQTSLPPALPLEQQLTLKDLTHRELNRLAVLGKIAELINSGHNFNEIWQRVLQVAVEATGAERGLLILGDTDNSLEVPTAFLTVPNSPAGLSYSRKVVGQVLETGLPLLSLDALSDSRLESSRSLKIMGTRSILCVPVWSRKRKLGLIYLDNSVRAGVFTELDLQLTQVIAGLAAASIERAQYFTQLAQNEKLAALGTALAGIVHELNNPLTAIVGFGELLEEEQLSEAAADMVQDLLKEARRSLNLIQDILFIARRGKAEMIKLDLTRLIRDTLDEFRSKLKLQGITLEAELPDHPLIIQGNAEQLRRVMVNLLINSIGALKNNPRGTIQVHLYRQPSSGTNSLQEDKPETDADKIMLVIRDNGCGINPEHLDRIFDPFFTTKKAGEGTGLGLSICNKIITDHGGSIQADNRAEGGAVFTITLPPTQSA